MVSEVFGPVWQGEGPATGERCFFLRMANCNLACGKGDGATWACDTPFTWDWSRHDRRVEVNRLTVADVVDQVRESMGFHTRTLIVSGGEPLLQAHLVDVVESLPGIDIDIETNGTRAPLDTDRIRRYVVSPKLANSGVRRDHRIKLDRLAQLAV